MHAGIGSRFQVEGSYVSCERYHGGHINDTYFAAYAVNGRHRRYVHQRINTRVFRDAHALTRNVAAVTRHMRANLQSSGITDVDRRVLRLVPTREGADVLVTESGEHWRTYDFVEQTVSRVHVTHARDAFEAARAFGEFSRCIADLPAETLYETIPGFHDTPARFSSFLEALASDPCNRAAGAKDEIAGALHFEPLSAALASLASRESLAVRATHNDSKITNVLFDARSGDAVCVVDLDTVMPGLTLYDAGELVRTASTHASEDEHDVTRVTVDRDLFAAVVRGFCEGAQDLVSPAEREAFALAGQVLAFENGIRFLTDYLRGDVYFRVHHPLQNLHRARTQFALVASLRSAEDVLCRI